MLLGARTLGHIHGVGQFVERNLALVRRLFADAAARAHQDVGERIENPPQHPERPCRELRETHRHGLRQYFGQYLAEQQQQEISHDRGRQHHRNRKNRIEQALDATRGTHSLPRGKQAQRKGDQQGKAARFNGHPKRAIVDVAQKGSQRGQGPLLIPQHDRRCLYHLSAIKPTRAALGITRG